MSDLKEPTKKHRRKTAWLILLAVFLAGGLAVLFMNMSVKKSGARILTEKEAQALVKIDCILVLGCSVKADGSPSAMLEDRIREGVRLYQLGVSDRILMSGDHGRDEYDEVNTMKEFAVSLGVPAEHIFCDHAGFNTYDSMYRARDVFQAERVVIVTQEYHLYRALYISEKLGITAWGVTADPRLYVGQTFREVREIAARCKDFLWCIYLPEPEYLGDPIPIQGDASLSDG